MNTKQIREISKWMMIVGGGIFTCGLTTDLICNKIEKSEIKALRDADICEIEKEELIKKRRLEEEAIAAKTEKDHLYSEQLKNMDQKTFAKHHAEMVAKADDDVLERATQVRKNAEAQVAKTKMECNDEITKIRQECLEKIEAANAERDEAIAKYEQIDALFTNKKEILKAKEALEAAVRKDQVAKENKEELLKSIKDILE